MAARRRRARGDRGGVTAEFAVALPALLLIVTFALGAVDAVLAKVQCVDAARDAALVTARGGDGRSAGAGRAPRGATVRISQSADAVKVTVTLRVSPLGAHLGSFGMTATSTATVEPGMVMAP
jgi:Flp pilus assembly protein TadG